MSGPRRRTLAVGAAALLLSAAICAVTVTQATAAAAQDVQVQRTVNEHKVAVATAKDQLARAVTASTAVVTEHTTRQAVLAERPAFLAAVAAADAAFTSAADKVDVSTHRANVIAAQNTVLAERKDPEVIKAQAAAVTDIAGQVTAAVAAFDAQADADAAAAQSSHTRDSSGDTSQSSSGGGDDWFTDMRNRLTNIGGGGYNLIEYDGNCGAVWAVACAVPGTIKVNSSLAGWSGSERNWVVAHELAHQYQYAIWDQLHASPAFSALYGGNLERLANCMANAWGYGGRGNCSSADFDFARAVWAGNTY